MLMMLLALQVGTVDAARPVAAGPAAPKKICRSVTPTGSIMAKRICDTPENWAKYKADGERDTAVFIGHRFGAGMCDGPCLTSGTTASAR